jgi:hypothetical protein
MFTTAGRVHNCRAGGLPSRCSSSSSANYARRHRPRTRVRTQSWAAPPDAFDRSGARRGSMCDCADGGGLDGR